MKKNETREIYKKKQITKIQKKINFLSWTIFDIGYYREKETNIYFKDSIQIYKQ